MIARLLAAAALFAMPVAALAADAPPTDPQIAHIAYTAGKIDIAAGNLALSKSHNTEVRGFAEEMVRDHTAVNNEALALVKKLNVTPQDNPISRSLEAGAASARDKLTKLNGAAFDHAYVANEVAYHKAVNGALRTTLVPDAKNGDLKSLLETGLKLFTSHLEHAEHLAAELK
jgi:putative membrane protein